MLLERHGKIGAAFELAAEVEECAETKAPERVEEPW
jgi:hypothetical protein